MAALDRAQELNDTFREVAIDRIIAKLDELSADQLLRICVLLEDVSIS